MTRALPALYGKQWTITAGEHSATVVEVGAALLHYGVGGVDVTCAWPADQLPPKGCGATLVPWPNRLRNGRYDFEGTEHQLALTEPDTGNAIHGLGRWERWAKVRQSPEAITLRLDIVPQKGYPFPVRVEVTYQLHPEQGLMVTLGARNNGVTRAPFGAGSHPYLTTRGHDMSDVRLTIPAREILVLDDRQLPVGARTLKGKHDYRSGRKLKSERFDDAFTGIEHVDGRGAVELHTKSGGARVWFDETFCFLQIYTNEELTPGVPGVAIEPMTCAPNAFNSGAGLIILDPGGAWTGNWGIEPL